eukprot:4925798-Pyramimonas_sp.AAC.1
MDDIGGAAELARLVGLAGSSGRRRPRPSAKAAPPPDRRSPPDESIVRVCPIASDGDLDRLTSLATRPHETSK